MSRTVLPLKKTMMLKGKPSFNRFRFTFFLDSLIVMMVAKMVDKYFRRWSMNT